jgi:peptidase E
MVMARLYFQGGEDLAKRDSKEVNEKAFSEAGRAPVVLVFVGWTSKSVGESDRYRRIIVEYFEELGAREIVFAELSDSKEEIAEKMQRSDLVYLPGGDTRILVERLKDIGVDCLLRECDKIIIGNSAGALALCPECVLTRGREHPETEIFAGIGLVDFCVDVHYESSKDEELEELSFNRKIYAIPERSALVYDKGKISAIGNVYLFYKGKKTLLT